MNLPRITEPGAELHGVWADYRPTGLVELPEVARRARVARVLAKAEWQRPLGNFKALGGMYAALRALAHAEGAGSIRELLVGEGPRGALPRLICASDGNHGLAVAAAAARTGTHATVYLSHTVASVRAQRIEAVGGRVTRVAGTYDDAVLAAAAAAARGDGMLISDTASRVDDPVVRDVMVGYGLIATELVAQLVARPQAAPTHLFVQAGVGGLAAALADGLRSVMRAPGRIVVVEPETAACVSRALEAGTPVRIRGDLRTSAEMLSCGMASAPALDVLLRHAARSIEVSEEQLRLTTNYLRASNAVETTPSGAAGLAGLLAAAARPELRADYELDGSSTVLLVISEGSI